MLRHLDRSIEEIRTKLDSIAGLACKAVEGAASAALELRSDLAQKVVAGDTVIDSAEVELEELCLRVLALYQPVAQDLRSVIAALKINNDLERIGDLSVSIALRVQKIAGKQLPFIIPIEKMSSLCISLLKDSMIAFHKGDTGLARKVWERDSEVNELHRNNYGLLQNRMREDSDNIESYVSYLSISRNFERIADHATNIAEDVIYLIDGEIVRHTKL